MPTPMRVLLVDADEDSAVLMRGLIAEMAVPVDVERAASFGAGLERMSSHRYDVHLVACRLGKKSGVDLLRAYRESGGDGPVILIADEPERAEDLAAMESGAEDYLVRNRLDSTLLERSIRYAVEASKREAALRRIRDELETRVAERADALETMNEALAAEVAERRAAERALRAVDRRKDEFLATLAHELRNPLAPLSSATEILSRTGDTAEEGARRERALRVIERQVAHMVRLIDELLDLSRITHGKLELRREWVSLAAVIESALETAEPLLHGRRQAFELVVPETPVLLHADPMRLAQVLSNLLSNAAKYTEPGGRIRLEAVRDGEDVVVSVVDSGIGIPAAHLAHVFTMFGQGHRAHKAVYGGLGVGLALAKSLAELHGGSLTAASEGEGKGSVFTLRLACAAADAAAPLGRAGSAERAAAAAPDPHRGRQRRGRSHARRAPGARGARDARRARWPVRRRHGAAPEPRRRDPRHRAARFRWIRGGASPPGGAGTERAPPRGSFRLGPAGRSGTVPRGWLRPSPRQAGPAQEPRARPPGSGWRSRPYFLSRL